jgi:amino acid adenylation domain-containing protein/FkbH-like protein
MKSRFTTMVELLRWRAINQFHELAYIFLRDGEWREDHLTYGELDRQARAIGAHLRDLGGSGERVLLLYPPGLAFIPAFFGCLYAGAIAVPAYPPRLNRNLIRIQSIVADAQATMVISTTTIHSRLKSTLSAEFPELNALHWIATDEMVEGAESEWQEPAVTGSSLVFLQYTSGSTGTPKGVMLSHENLLYNAALVYKTLRHTPEDRYVSWLPTFHDMGFMAGVLQPMYGGFLGVQMSPASFLRHPVMWLQAITQYQGTTSGGPNFAYDLCVRKISPDQRETLDLSSWSVAFNGAEPVRNDTLERFIEAFEPCGFRRESFYPCYGLAEATLIVSGSDKEAAPVVSRISAKALEHDQVIKSLAVGEAETAVVSCGRSLRGQGIAIVDPDTLRRRLPGEVGEIWVAGPSVALGYWNRLDETEHTFHARLSDTGEGPFLRTGDLGFILNDELYLTGRLKDLIIIRGRNLYPQDLEFSVGLCDPALRPGCTAVFSVTARGAEKIVVIQEIDRRWRSDLEKVIEKIRQVIAEEHEVNAHAVILIKAGTIPKTSSGKIQRYLCREAFMSDSFDVVGRWIEPDDEDDEINISESPGDIESAQDLEGWLVRQLAASLKTKLSEIDVSRSIIEQGLDSMMAVETMHAIENRLAIKLPISRLLQPLSVSQIAAQAFAELQRRSTGQQRISYYAPPSLEGGYELSIGQQALWFLYKEQPKSAAYNVSRAMKITGPLDVDALRAALQSLVDRHSILRTRFKIYDGKPRQQVLEKVDLYFQEEDASTWGESAINDYVAKHTHHPFDLERESIFRVRLLTLPSTAYLLVVVAHHIVVDLWSLTLLIDELISLYEAGSSQNPVALSPLKLQYFDYVRWQAELLAGPEGERLTSYWRDQLDGNLPFLNIPADRPRPTTRSDRGRVVNFNLGSDLTRKLKSFCRQQGITLYTVLLSAFQTLMHRSTRDEEILVGSPTLGRNHAGFANVVGYFVNPVVIKADFSGDPTFNVFIHQVYRTVLGALEHQDYPFALLVKQIRPLRDFSRSPIFDVMFALQRPHLSGKEDHASFVLGQAGSRLWVGNLTWESIAIERQSAQFDLVLTIADLNDELSVSIEYSTDLFEAVTIERLWGHYDVLLRAIIAEPARRISHLPWLTEIEHRELLSEWNRGEVNYQETDLSLPELFTLQAARSPEVVAVVCGNEHLSYGMLDQHTNKLAWRLRGMGVGPESNVGVVMERSVEIVVGLLGILKTGGAYVPLDPMSPRKYLSFQLTDSQVKVLLTQSHLALRDGCEKVEVVYLDALQWHIMEESQYPLLPIAFADHPAYVIYTSGSTGVPKGVVVEHRSLSNYLQWCIDKYLGEGGTGAPVQSPINFDLTVTSLFSPLLTGKKVVLLPDGTGIESLGAALLAEGDFSLIKITPAHLELLSRVIPPLEAGRSARTLVIGGEKLQAEPLKFWIQNAPAMKLINEYGPTEATVGCISYQIESSQEMSGTVAIGRPIANTEIYVLDENLQPAPAGVPGEIYVGGKALARGYLNRPDLTAERFVPHLFSHMGGARLYRTGDLGRYRRDGNVEFLSRTDHQVKVRGYRIELGEIESVLRQCPAVAEAAVLAREDRSGDRRLVAYLVAEPGAVIETALVRGYLRGMLPEYMLPSSFVTLQQLPLTSNGKLDYRLLPEPESDRPELSVGYMAPRSDFEEIMAGLWSDLLGMERVGVFDDFFELGGHSLLATALMSRIDEQFGVSLSLRTLFENPNIAALTQEVVLALRCRQLALPPPLKRAERKCGDLLPLSHAQQRLWFLDRLEPGNAFYNLQMSVRLRGRLEIEVMERSWAELVRRHEILRTRFITIDGVPGQVIGEPWAVPIVAIDLTHLESHLRESAVLRVTGEELQRGFDLAAGPLFRLSLLQLDSVDHVLMITIHHIISDGWSVGVLVRELAALYTAFLQNKETPLPDLPIQYADYAIWQREHLREVAKSQLCYWREKLSEVPPLHLPTVRRRPPVQTFTGAMRRFTLSSELSRSIRTLSRSENATLFMSLLAAFQLLLMRWSGETVVSVGIPVAGRACRALEGLIGFFVNTLVVQTRVEGGESFRQLLSRVKEAALGAYTHQDVPFEMLVEQLRPARDPSQTPLFQVFFNMLLPPQEKIELTDLTSEVEDPFETNARFDLTLYVRERGAEIEAALVYNTALFERSGMIEFSGQFTHLLSQLVEDADKDVGSYSLVTPEAQQVLPDPCQSLNDACGDLVMARFSRQAQRVPARYAVIDAQDGWTYHELDMRSDQLANFLRENGVERQGVVAIYGHRSASLIWAILGTMKSGAAFVILDPADPAARTISYLELVKPTGWIQLKAAGELPKALSDYLEMVQYCCRLELPRLAEAVKHDLRSGQAGVGVKADLAADDLAYLSFTSGSTGQPKCIAGTHRPIAHFLQWYTHRFELGESDHFSMLSGLAHDPLLRDIFTPLWLGATLCIPTQDEMRVAERLVAWMRRQEISVAHLVPTMGYLLTETQHINSGEEALRSLRYVLFSGEPLPPRLVSRIRQLAPSATCVNFYGATETPQAMSYYLAQSGEEVNEGEESDLRRTVPIGRGIDDVQLLVLNAGQQLCGVGELGEIYVRTSFLAKGYLGDDVLTAARFIVNPFTGDERDRLYRTGDKGCYLPDGNVEISGRIDRQVNVRGFRLELGEIEATLSQYPGIGQVVVIAEEGEIEGHRLVAYLVANRASSPSVSELRSYLQKSLPDYMTPSSFVTLQEMPLTPSGKLDRRALSNCLEKESEKQSRIKLAPRTVTEEILAQIWSGLLGVDRIGVNDNFFELGGHSLLATRLISRVRDSFEVELTPRAIFESQTMAGLAAKIEGKVRGGGNTQSRPIRRISRDEDLPLSFAQERFYVLDKLESGNNFFNIHQSFRLKGRLDIASLEQSFNHVFHRHESLRTRLTIKDCRPVQVIAPVEQLKLPVIDLSRLPADAQESEVRNLVQEEAGKPFQVTRARLIRVSLLKLNDEEHVVLLTMHHLISDGWSVGILIREVAACYEAFSQGQTPSLTELPLQYADVAAWQRQEFSGEMLESRLTYWKQKLAGAPSTLDLPTDYERPELRTTGGARCSASLPAALVEKLKTLSCEQGTTLFIIMLAALKILLFKWTGQRSLVIGTVTANRHHTETENLIGCFVNFLPVRSEIHSEWSCLDLLKEIRTNVLEIYAHQDCPFEKIVEAINPERSSSRNPLFNVAFLLQNFPRVYTFNDHLEASAIEVETHHSLLDLRIGVEEGAEGVRFWWEYSTDLFQAETIEYLVAAYGHTLQLLAQKPEAAISSFSVPDELEAQAREARAREGKQTIAIASTFTAEPVEEPLDFWMSQLGIRSRYEFAPYNQVFQQLLDRSSLLARNRDGVNVVLIRFEDWTGSCYQRERRLALSSSQSSEISRNVHDLLDALRSARRLTVPCLVCLCPAAPGPAGDPEREKTFKQLEDLMEAECEKLAGVYLVRSDYILTTYPVPNYYDSQADRLGHIPYTSAFFTALGTTIARKINAIVTPPYKVLVLDCDDTIWKGTCGEDGVEGIEIDDARRQMQEFIVRLHDQGMLICLCSKNNEEDVAEVFARRLDMPLRREHVTAWRINWESKPQNLKSLATELQLGLDSFVFIDNDPVACLEASEDCPEVLTLLLPQEADRIPTFMRHVWAFDRVKATEEDRNRAACYRQNSQREILRSQTSRRSQTSSLSSFLAAIELKVQISKMKPQHLARVAQLTQRTNQFNFTGMRRNENELLRLFQLGGYQCLITEVSDRFGDYGLVGAVIYRAEAINLKVETFLLSCRALGRKVEHQMMVKLGELALQQGLTRLEIPFIETRKNRVGWEFLSQIGAGFKRPQGNGWIFHFPAEYAASLLCDFNPIEGAGEILPSSDRKPEGMRRR